MAGKRRHKENKSNIQENHTAQQSNVKSPERRSGKKIIPNISLGTVYRNLKQLTDSGSIKTIQEEIDKCEIRCSNCHRVATYKRRK